MGRGPTKKYHKLMNSNYIEGTLTCLKLEIIKKIINIAFPLVLNIEHTNACNLNCTCCPRKLTVNQQGTNYISMNTYKWGYLADQVQVKGVHDWSGAIDIIKITDETVTDRYPCALLWYALAVNSNGKVSICNVDWDYSGVVGKINEKSLQDIV